MMFSTRFNFPVCGLLHFGVELLHAVDKERSRKLIGVPLWKKCLTSTHRASKGMVGAGSLRQGLDALLTVIVVARQDLGLFETIMANWTRDLLFQFF